MATATFVVADADAALMIESIRDSEDEECGSKNVVSQMLVTVSSFRQWLKPAGDLTHNLHLPQGGCKANKQCRRSTSMLHGGTGIFLTKSLFVFSLGCYRSQSEQLGSSVWPLPATAVFSCEKCLRKAL